MYQNHKSKAPGCLSHFPFCCPEQLSPPPKKRRRRARSRSWDNIMAEEQERKGCCCNCMVVFPMGHRTKSRFLGLQQCGPVSAIFFIPPPQPSNRHPLIQPRGATSLCLWFSLSSFLCLVFHSLFGSRNSVLNQKPHVSSLHRRRVCTSNFF